MKKNNQYSKGLLALLVAGGLCFSCSDNTMDSINRNNDNASSVPEKLLVTDLEVSTGFSNIGGDFNTYLASYVEHEVGVHNQLYRAEYRTGEPQAASTFNNVWNNLYSTLKNARIAKTQALGNENYVTGGIASVLAAYTSALITDMFGDTPWSQAALVSETGAPVYMNPAIDPQQTIYDGVLAELDEAIGYLAQGDVSAISTEDVIYGGSAAAWTKFAYALKARYTMRLLYRETAATALQNVLDYISKSYTSASDQAQLSIYNNNNLNPLFDFQWSRDGLAASQSISEKLIARNDPRISRVFVGADWVQITGPDDPNFLMAPNGECTQVQYYYNTSVFVFSQTAPTQFLSYHELQFLKAEAMVRLGQTEAAKEVVLEGIKAAFANLEVSVTAAMTAPTVMGYGGLAETTAALTEEDAVTYFETSVEPLFDANPLQETMIQKYLAFFGASGESTECYNDVRRLKALGEDYIILKNPNRFPLRCPYGNSDTTTNPEVREAYGNGSYVFTENVWWAGGSR